MITLKSELTKGGGEALKGFSSYSENLKKSDVI